MQSIPSDTSIDNLVEAAVAKTRELVQTSEVLRDRAERASRKRFSRLFRDPRAIDVTVRLTDEVMRIRSVESSIKIFRQAARESTAQGFGTVNAAGLHFLSFLSHLAPSPVIALVHRRIRFLTRNLILSGEQPILSRHLRARARSGIALNINVLGEAVLGEREARARRERVLEMIRRSDVDYVSVKLSSVVSQIITIDRDDTIERVCERLREIYLEGQTHATFINLDMEEYRDLDLTVSAFQRVLGEAQFAQLSAGIVLQAYLPESHDVLAGLIDWAQSRFERTGGTIKIRLVKGANLAMERAEAELHGWSSAPYRNKYDVDASYARLIDSALRPEHASALRIGVASHNLFHVNWAIEVARARGVLDQLDVEMLEGMANAEALALTRSGHPVLLYAPVTSSNDFASAVAYLVRRLDENTSPENYLRAAFEIATDEGKFAEQRNRFLNSIRERHSVFTTSLRHRPSDGADPTRFANCANSDPTDPQVREQFVRALKEVRTEVASQIPLVIGGHEIITVDTEAGRDPSCDGQEWYRYGVADRSQIDEALRVARAALVGWSALSNEQRRLVMLTCADVMEDHRARTLAVMARDAGKTFEEGDPEVSEGVDFARYYAHSAIDFSASSPLGVVLVVPPWNFPYAIVAGGVCAALAAGNTVVLKPAPEAVATAWELVQQLWDGGVTREVLQFVPTRDDECGKHLVTHRDVDAVVLTGSFDTAALFTGWRRDINLLAETSGKNAILVSSCADIDAAVKDIVHSAFSNAGQKCSAASLAIVVQDLYDDPAFLAQLSDAVTSLSVGPSWQLATSVGPIIRRAESVLERALSHLDPGESWLVEPIPLDVETLQWRPGVKIGVQPGSWSHLNEWFGPVLAVMVAPDFETAIRWQNQTSFALTAGVQSLSDAECELWIENVEAGNLYVNRGVTGAVVARQPFGGWKRSSVGPTAKAGGANYVNGLREWNPVTDVFAAEQRASDWWSQCGSLALDESKLTVERNYVRYRRHLLAIGVRVDAEVSQSAITFINFIAHCTEIAIEFSASALDVRLPSLVVESVEEFAARSGKFGRVRWLSREEPPVTEVLQNGVSVDRRCVAQRGDVEMPRWLLEQSVAITNHRYGNVHAGPKPRCLGLGDLCGPAAQSSLRD
ncbi:MAG: bifunctional proline dehydrogenase/L-glutamate gamma-semialdehyde dehydrogenase [Acidimicrobiaceae bacterium]|nr:bifunctional proline dehydrogenase/L-glutamate gamma-semialdehyde dehydrogenase [Acidimicrobiaceae bacterium]